jgi:hypothetical protein
MSNLFERDISELLADPRVQSFEQMPEQEIENLLPRPIPSWSGVERDIQMEKQTGVSNMNGRPFPTGWEPGGSGWNIPAIIGAGVGVYNAIWGGEESGKGETVAETSSAEWYTDMPYSSGVPTKSQLGLHSHPHPRGLVHRRRRRRKLLTASDKADIAFITGTLGKGEMGRTAIAALLSRRMS